MLLVDGPVIPEPYQPLIFASFGICGWVIVFNVLYRQRIDVNILLHTASGKRQNLIVMATALVMLLLFHIGLLEHTVFRQYTNLVDHFGPVALCYSIAIAFILSCTECRTFLRRLDRLFRNCPVYFSDVLIADVMISFSGVFTGIFVNVLEQFNISSSSKCVPYITCIPYLIRLRQCLSEYYHASELNQQHNSKSKLINSFKYASSIPVIFLAHYTKQDIAVMKEFGTNRDMLSHTWLVLAMLTNMFAFGWDLTMDWGLIQLDADTIRLRKDMHFVDPLYYVIAVGINAGLRLLKVGSHLYHIHPFCVDLAEIVRRWVWVVFRLEHEWVKRSYSHDLERVTSE